jgi:hypothetical protein
MKGLSLGSIYQQMPSTFGGKISIFRNLRHWTEVSGLLPRPGSDVLLGMVSWYPLLEVV